MHNYINIIKDKNNSANKRIDQRISKKIGEDERLYKKKREMNILENTEDKDKKIEKIKIRKYRR